MLIRASWQLSASVAAVCFALFLLARGRKGRAASLVAAFGAEFAMVAGVFAVYQHTAHFAHTKTAGAVENAATIEAIQGFLPLPDERWVQGLILPFRGAVDAANIYYAGMHLTTMTGFLVWMWWRHREQYAWARNTVALTTLICVTVQMIPVAPPRLMPDSGFVDTGLAYGMSVYGPQGQGIAAQLAAMPSLHVAWAGIVAYFGVTSSTSRWRWLLLGHFLITVFVVVATANHWWLDGIAGLSVAAAVAVALRRVSTKSGTGMERAALAPLANPHD